MDYQDMPQGLGVALARHPNAMERFGSMTEAERQSVISSAQQVRSEQEMQALVDRLMQ